MYLVLSALISSPLSLVAATKASAINESVRIISLKKDAQTGIRTN